MFVKLKKLHSPKRRNQILLKLAILLVSAFVLTWLLEYRYFLNNITETWDFVQIHTLVYLYSVVIMFTIELLFYGVIRRPFLTVSVVASLILLVGYLHIAKFNLRGIPLFPEDFQLGDQAGVMTQFVDFFQVIRLFAAIILTIMVGVVLDRLTGEKLIKERPIKSVWWRRYLLVSRIAIAAVAIVGFMTLTDFARNHNGTRVQELPWLDSHFTAWNQIWNYNDNGFLIGFLYNCNKSILKEPDGYSKAKVKEIMSEFNKDTGGTNLAKADYNIVLILDESFYDPSIISEYYNYDGGDVTPNLHALQQKYPSGKMHTIDYGGGTANVEFEVLTGLTNYWMQTVPYTNLIPKKKQVPSIASYAKSHGFKTLAMHPFAGGMYKRNSVLPILGFEQFIEEKDFKHTDKDGESNYINDKSAYAELMDQLRSEEKKQLVSLVTMQNHASYHPNEYGESLFKLTNEHDKKDAIETFLMTLHLSDQYLGELIAELDNFEEKTVVLFYGDHSPGIFNDVLYHEDETVQTLSRITPYFIYSNFELPNIISELPTTSPNCLTNTLFDLLGLEKSTILKITNAACKNQPILDTNYFGDAAPFMDTELSAYQMLTYDLVGGKQYSLSN